MAGAVRAEKGEGAENVGREGQRGGAAPEKCQVSGASNTELKSQTRSHKQFPAQTVLFGEYS